MDNTVEPGRSTQDGVLAASYVLPIAAHAPQGRALSGYLRRLSRTLDDVIVVDGSPQETFDVHARLWSAHVRHLRPAAQTTNGKVGGVMTGVRAARHECVIVADDDVRYRRAELVRVLALLRQNDVVRPQNFFRPLPWHARWDTARSLLNRLAGGDWPGTLAIRRSVLLDAGGYSGEVLFENLELVRTIRAAGGREAVPLDLFVARRPPGTAHFLSQRTRQAYDEWARPGRLAAQMALLPSAIMVARWGSGWLLAAAAAAVAAAEIGRRKAGGRTVFPSSSALWAPAWLAERAVTSWMAFSLRVFFGGVRYRTTRLRHAATAPAILRERVARRRAAQDPSTSPCHSAARQVGPAGPICSRMIPSPTAVPQDESGPDRHPDAGGHADPRPLPGKLNKAPSVVGRCHVDLPPCLAEGGIHRKSARRDQASRG